MESINVRGIIEYNTLAPKTLWAAKIDGRFWYGKNGKILYETKGGLKSALRQSSLWYRIIKPIADNLAAFRNITDPKEIDRIRDKMWYEFIEGEGSRVKIFAVNLE